MDRLKFTIFLLKLNLGCFKKFAIQSAWGRPDLCLMWVVNKFIERKVVEVSTVISGSTCLNFLFRVHSTHPTTRRFPWFL